MNESLYNKILSIKKDVDDAVSKNASAIERLSNLNYVLGLEDINTLIEVMLDTDTDEFEAYVKELLSEKKNK